MEAQSSENFPEEAEPVLEMISELYRIKYELSGEARQKEWEEIIDKRFSYLLGIAQRPKSVLQSAIAYTLNAPDGSVYTSIKYSWGAKKSDVIFDE